MRIANCSIESVDDAIVLKTTMALGVRRSTENVTVTNCLLTTECNGFKTGTESSGDFKRIAVSNCVVRGTPHHPPTGGVCIETVDGANIEGVTIDNITMVDAREPIFIRLGNRGRAMDVPVPGTLKDVIISNITATGANIASTVTGIPERAVENVSLSHIRMAYAGGVGAMAPTDSMPEMVKGLPRPRDVRPPARVRVVLPARQEPDRVRRAGNLRGKLLPDAGTGRCRHCLAYEGWRGPEHVEGRRAGNRVHVRRRVATHVDAFLAKPVQTDDATVYC